VEQQQLQLTQEQKELLQIPRAENEIKETIFVLESRKAYAPNGFAVEFLNTFESEIISGLCHQAFEKGSLPDSHREATIFLLLKPDYDPLEGISFL